MFRAYIFVHLRSRDRSKPVICVYQSGESQQYSNIPYWQELTGNLAALPDKPVKLHIGTKQDVVQECKGIFETSEAAEAAALDACLDYLAETFVQQRSTGISWRQDVFRNKKGSFQETTWARSYGQHVDHGNWWQVIEVDVIV